MLTNSEEDRISKKLQAPGENKFGLTVGVILVAFAVVMLLAVVWSIRPRGFVDFPCLDVQQGNCLMGYGPYSLSQVEISRLDEAQMYLCVSEYPRGWQGGGTIAQGPEFSGTWSYGDVELVRQGDSLVVNGQSLPPGESVSNLRISPTFNPWLFNSTRTTIAHRGIFGCFVDQERDEQAVDLLYVYGNVSEGWALNPLGLVILAGGGWLIVREVRARRCK